MWNNGLRRHIAEGHRRRCTEALLATSTLAVHPRMVIDVEPEKGVRRIFRIYWSFFFIKDSLRASMGMRPRAPDRPALTAAGGCDRRRTPNQLSDECMLLDEWWSHSLPVRLRRLHPRCSRHGASMKSREVSRPGLTVIPAQGTPSSACVPYCPPSSPPL